jgi:adenylosuccinate synthase
MNIVVVGAQWGDEGKGKIVDYLASESDLVIRFSGGANAGHTIVIGDETYKLHLIPSGIVYPDQSVLLGSGMVIDPEALFEELSMLEEKGIDWKGRVFISDRAHMVLPGHKRQDLEMDRQRKQPLGTTGRGIGITYALKAHRMGLRFADVENKEARAELDENDRAFIDSYAEKLTPMIVDIASYMADSTGKRVLFEGAQGVLLDIDCGTYPYVSSGSSIAAGAAAGCGIGPRNIDKVLGVFKAYQTRVGNGPFPTEFTEDRDGDLEHRVRELGREYGVTTGRPRRCGYLDLVALRYACRVSSIDDLVLTHIDVYDEMDTISVCTAYEIDGRRVENFPASAADLAKARPVLREFPGWKQSVRQCKSFEEFPEETQDYIRFIEEFTQTRVGIVSVGYRRSETILRTAPWTQL